MYYLINQMSATDHYAGHIVSRHYTAEAADRADTKLQRAVRRKNGSGSFLPTIIRTLRRPYRTGETVQKSDVDPWF